MLNKFSCTGTYFFSFSVSSLCFGHKDPSNQPISEMPTSGDLKSGDSRFCTTPLYNEEKFEF